jgi:hypothetical protein
LSHVLDYPYTDGAAVTFVPAKNYCNSRGSDAAAVVSFRAVAFAQGTKTIVSVSDVYEQSMSVQCLADPLTLTAPTDELSVKARRLPTSIDTQCFGHTFDPALTDIAACHDDALVINDIQVQSRDSFTERVVVTVQAKIGYLTFNRHSWNKTLPVSGRRSVSQRTVFMAYPEALTDIFANLQYQTFVPSLDTIEITLQYRDCLSTNETTPQESMPTADCQVLHHAILVNSVGSSEKRFANGRIGSHFPWQILLCWLGYPAIYFCYVRLERQLKGGVNEDDNDTVCDGVGPQWIQYMSESGDYYYENIEDGTVTWLAPVGELFVPWAPESTEAEAEDTIV